MKVAEITKPKSQRVEPASARSWRTDQVLFALSLLSTLVYVAWAVYLLNSLRNGGGLLSLESTHFALALVLLTAAQYFLAFRSRKMRLSIDGVKFGSAVQWLPLKAPIATLFNGSLSEGWWSDYNTLVCKHREQSITGEEHRELVLRNDMLEELQLGRARMMTALAGTLGISEEQLVEQYDIRPREVG